MEDQIKFLNEDPLEDEDFGFEDENAEESVEDLEEDKDEIEDEIEDEAEEEDEDNGKEKKKRELRPLTKEELKNPEKFDEYEENVSSLEGMFKGNDSGFRNALRSLNATYAKKSYAKTGKTAKPKQYIPQLERLMELKKTIESKVSNFIEEECKDELNALENYIVGELEYEGDLPEYELYHKGINPVKKFITENYEEVERN